MSDTPKPNNSVRLDCASHFSPHSTKRLFMLIGYLGTPVTEALRLRVVQVRHLSQSQLFSLGPNDRLGSS
jgi:hypothetical protein